MAYRILPACVPPLLAAALLVSGLLAGCATLRGFPNPPATTNVDSPTPGWELSPGAIKVYNAETNPAKRKQLRNEIIDARIDAIDAAFSDYEREIFKEDVGSGIASDWMVLGLTAATTVVGAASTKTALGAASTAVVGGSASFDKRALFDKTLPALISQMVGARETVRAEIKKGQQLDVTDYSWSAADSDLQRFAYAGSLIGAIASVTQDAGEKAANAKQQVRDVTNEKYQPDDNTKTLRNFWKPNGTINKDNETRLKQWMTDNSISVAPGMVSEFLVGPDFKSDRAKAVQDLGLGK